VRRAPLKVVVGALVLVALTVPLAAAGAHAGKLPAQEGDWLYDAPSAFKVTDKLALFRAYVHVTSDAPGIYGMDGTLFGGVCKKNGQARKQPIVWAALHLRVLVGVKADGSFSGTRSVIGDATGTKGSVTVKGVFNGKHVTGTVVEHLHDPNWGACSGTGKFSSIGTQIG
jgi:hypothetical protein